MKRVLVVQHVAYEILGTLDPLLRDCGIRIRYVNFSRTPEKVPNLDKYEGLILLGGPMSAYDTENYPHLKTEVELIQHAVDQEIPVLGICLGAQLVAKALGADVVANPKKEIGWYPIKLTKEGRGDEILGLMKPEECIFQWHGDTFEIPKGAVRLAESASCSNQAFRFGDRVYGFQFHLEVDSPMIERWLQVPHHAAEIEKEGLDPHQIREQTGTYIDRSLQLSELVFRAFVDRFRSSIRRKRLQSGH